MLRRIEDEKAKIRLEFEAKEKQVDIQKRVSHSTDMHNAQLKILSARAEAIQGVHDEALERLSKLTQDRAEYGKLLVSLIFQAIVTLRETTFTVHCRQEDATTVADALRIAVSDYENKNAGVKLTASVSKEHLTQCRGGIVLAGMGDRIKVNNTLEARLSNLFEAKLPEIRIAMFGRSPTRKHLD